MFCNIAIGHEPRHGLHPKSLGVQNQVWDMAPEPHADYDIWLKPAIVPLLFQIRFQVYRMNIHAHLGKASA
jgi:hypothetical protein